jgi:hypothetical protein
VPPTSLSKLPRARGGARRAGVDRRAGSGTTGTDALIIELTEQECRAALLILAHARTSLACDVGSTVEDATVVRLPMPGRCSMTGARSSAAAAEAAQTPGESCAPRQVSYLVHRAGERFAPGPRTPFIDAQRPSRPGGWSWSSRMSYT